VKKWVTWTHASAILCGILIYNNDLPQTYTHGGYATKIAGISTLYKWPNVGGVNLTIYGEHHKKIDDYDKTNLNVPIERVLAVAKKYKDAQTINELSDIKQPHGDQHIMETFIGHIKHAIRNKQCLDIFIEEAYVKSQSPHVTITHTGSRTTALQAIRSSLHTLCINSDCDYVRIHLSDLRKGFGNENSLGSYMQVDHPFTLILGHPVTIQTYKSITTELFKNRFSKSKTLNDITEQLKIWLLVDYKREQKKYFEQSDESDESGEVDGVVMDHYYMKTHDAEDLMYSSVLQNSILAKTSKGYEKSIFKDTPDKFKHAIEIAISKISDIDERIGRAIIFFIHMLLSDIYTICRTFPKVLSDSHPHVQCHDVPKNVVYLFGSAHSSFFKNFISAYFNIQPSISVNNDAQIVEYNTLTRTKNINNLETNVRKQRTLTRTKNINNLETNVRKKTTN
jgi:hypothetical protein